MVGYDAKLRADRNLLEIDSPVTTDFPVLLRK